MSDGNADVNLVRKSFQQLSWLDHALFVFMLAICGGIGIYFGFVNKQKSTQDYLMGGRNMNIIPVCFSLVASFISGISFLGIPTEIYVYGTSYLFMLIGTIVMCVLICFTIIPVLHELRLTSAYEYLQMRFDRRLRVFGSLLFSVYLMAWLPIVIYVPALAFNQVTGINIHIVTPIVCFVCIFYTTLGGLKAVVWTDVIQTVVMISAMLVIVVKGTAYVGGIEKVLKRNWNTGRIEFPVLSMDITERHTILSVTVGSSIYWIGNVAVNQSMLQRFLSLPELRSSQRAVWGFFVGLVFIVMLCAYSGMVAFARYHSCDPLDSGLALAKDQVLPLLVMDVLSDWKGLPGIFLAGVFSAALSSLSTGLNSMAAVVLEDFWKPFFRPLSHRETQVLIRAVVVFLGLISLGLVFVVEKLGSVLQLTMSLSSASMGPLVAIYFMGLFLPFVNSNSALIGGIAGLLSAWWVTAQSQITQARGWLKFPEKERFAHNCSYIFEPMKHLNSVNSEEVFVLYRISYLWLSAFGCLVTIVISIILSWKLGSNRKKQYDLRLLAPIIRSRFSSDNDMKLTAVGAHPDNHCK